MVDTNTEIGSEADPAQIWSKQPATHGIDLTPYTCKVRHGTTKGEDVDRGGHRTANTEIKRGPEQIQDKLDGVKSGSMFSKGNGLGID